MNIGFIGLGNLGAPIAENLVQSGHKPGVYNRTASKMQPLINKGATGYASVREISENSDVIISMVSDDTALNKIALEDDGIMSNLKPGGIHISMSTILPETADTLAEMHKKHNQHYVACPVMGRPEAARMKKLNFLLSGELAVIEKIRPLLKDAGAENVWYFGEKPSNANIAKLCNNFMILAAVESMAEGMRLAKQSGIDPALWFETLMKISFGAPVYNTYGSILLKEAYLPAGFSLSLAGKDANLINQQAEMTGTNMDIARLLQFKLQNCIANGLGDHDVTAIAIEE